MDDLFGVTELVKKLEDEESVHRTSNEKHATGIDQVEISPTTK